MINYTWKLILDLIRDRAIIYVLSKRDYQEQYQGSYLGFIWHFLQPLLFITVLFLVITLGFRVGNTVEMPFVLYLVTGIIAWMYFSGNLSRNSMVLRNHAFLVKKINIRLSLLPLVQVLSSLIPHFFLISIAIGIAWFNGFHPTIYTVQVVYYLICMIYLLIGIAWITASTSLFIKDVNKLVTVFIQFGFWLTPIFWNIDMIADKYHWLIELNPIFYIVSGYRDSIVSSVPFWHKPYITIYFWLISTLIMLFGIYIFRRLRPHFAEVI